MSVEKLPKVVNMLKQKETASVTKIAEEIGSDRRTVEKILNVASNLGIVKCNTLQMSGRKYQVCQLDSNYRKLLTEREPEK
jgi:predicted transcriptional regulator